MQKSRILFNSVVLICRPFGRLLFFYDRILLSGCLTECVAFRFPPKKEKEEKMMERNVKKNFLCKLFSVLLTFTMVLSPYIVKAAIVDEEKEIVFASHRDQVRDSSDAVFVSQNMRIWEPLITMDEEGEPSPALATEWNKNEDATEWVFTLRKGVKFHDGSDFNADVVLLNFERWKKGPFSSEFNGINMENTFPGLQEVKKADDYTIALAFEEPVPTLDYNMMDYGSPIFQPGCFGEDGTFVKDAIGTGPYKLKEYKKDEYCLVERFEDYWGEKAKAKYIRCRTIPDANTKISALKSEEIMAVMDIGAIQPNLAKELLKDERFQVTSSITSKTHHIQINMNKEPFSDVRLRKAMSMMVDRDAIVEQLYDGYGETSSNWLTSTCPFYKEEPIEYNPEEAKNLAKEVLGNERVSAVFLMRTKDLDRYPFKAEAEYLQSIFAEIGIDLNIQILEENAVYELWEKGEFDLGLAMQSFPNSEPYARFQGMFASDGSTNVQYNRGYKNQKMDSLLEKVKNEMDMKQRAELYGQMQDILIEDLPVISLYQEEALAAYNTKITGYELKPNGFNLAEVTWTE